MHGGCKLKASYEISNSGQCTTVRLIGAWSKDAAEELEEELLRSLSKTSTLWVVYDLRSLTAFNVLARSVLVRMHTKIGAQIERCTFIADDTRFRGLALWVLHLSGEKHGTVVKTRAQADEWFAQGSARG